MRTTSLELSLSAVGASHTNPEHQIGSHCAQTGYIRNDARCVFRSGLLTQIRRTMIEARAGQPTTQSALRARAEILVYDAARLAAGAIPAEIARIANIWTSAGREVLNRRMHSFLESLATMSTDVGLPGSEAESQRMLWNYLQCQQHYGKGAR